MQEPDPILLKRVLRALETGRAVKDIARDMGVTVRQVTACVRYAALRWWLENRHRR